MRINIRRGMEANTLFPGYTNPNMLKDGVYTQENPYVLHTNSRDGFVHIHELGSVMIKRGQTYTYQFCSDGSLGYVKEAALPNKCFNSFIINGVDSVYFYCDKHNVLLSPRLFWYSWTFTWPYDDLWPAYVRVGTWSDGTIYNTIKFWDFKLELGSIATAPNYLTGGAEYRLISLCALTTERRVA